MLSVPVQHFQSAIFEAWQLKISSHLTERVGSGQFLGVTICLHSVGNGFLLEKAKGDDVVKCRFCGAEDGDGHVFWDCTCLPNVHVRELPKFLPLLVRDRSGWPRCLLWLPGLGKGAVRSLSVLEAILCEQYTHKYST